MSDFAEGKKAAMSRLQSVQDRLNGIQGKYCLEFQDIQDKLAAGMQNLVKEKFRLAFFGSFSDGKSSLLSALTQRIDIDIAPQPSTDRLNTYEFGDYFIVDTPGLFSEQQMHDELTRKFISEANVVIFTVDAVNPLRESHRKILRWLMADLQKMDATIFVLNKMDSVADLEDDAAFESAATVKKIALRETLGRHLEVASNPVAVAVAADPYGLGLAHWLEHEQEYFRLSRIGSLVQALNTFVEQAKEDLLIRAGESVLNEAVLNAAARLETAAEQADKEAQTLQKELENLEETYSRLNAEINRKNADIREELVSFRENILAHLQGATDVKGLREIVNMKIGTDGGILEEKVDLIVRKHSGDLVEQERRLFLEVEQSLGSLEAAGEELRRHLEKAGVVVGEKILGATPRQLADGVLRFRDMLAKTGWVIKFKPYGALKWAKRIANFGKILKALPILMEVLQIASKSYQGLKFEKERQKIEAEISQLFKDILDEFSFENYRKVYFPQAIELPQTLQFIGNQKQGYVKAAKNMRQAVAEIRQLVPSG